MADQGRSLYQRFKESVKSLKIQLIAIYYAIQEKECGWLPRLIALIAIAYAVSPIDLIPDFIPILGLVDDLLILPGLLWLSIKLIPESAMEKGKQRAHDEPLRLSSSWSMAILFFFMWDSLAGCLVYLAVNKWGNSLSLPIRWIIVGAVVMILVLLEVLWSWMQIRKERVQHAAAAAAAREPLLQDEVDDSPVEVV